MPDEVSEKQLRNKCKDADGAVCLAFKLFEKLYESRQTLDALQSIIQILKGELKKRDEEDRKKDAELMKLRQIADKVKMNTEEMSDPSKDLTNISLGASSENKSYADAVGQKSNTYAEYAHCGSVFAILARALTSSIHSFTGALTY